MPDSPTPMENSEDIKAEIEHLLYSWEAPHFQNPNPNPIEKSLLEIIEREKVKAVKQALLDQQERLRRYEEALKKISLIGDPIAEEALLPLRPLPTT